MRIGIIGLVGSGKSSLFYALTGQPPEPPSGKPHRRLGQAVVPDERVELVARLDGSKKISNAVVTFMDPDGFNPDQGKSLSSEMLGMVRDADLLALVVRDFKNPTVMHPSGKVDAKRDLESCLSDLIIQDLAVAENKLMKARKEFERGKKELQKEVETLGKAIEILNEGKFLSSNEWAAQEKEILDSFEPLTFKQGLVLWNVDEDTRFGSDGTGVPPEVLAIVKSHEWDIGATSLAIESEIMEIEEKDRKAFLEDMGLKETIRDRFLRAVYEQLGLVTFYTGGPKEAAARAIPSGSTAWDAAGNVHTDIQKGFIRAEVMSFEDLKELGTVDVIRKAGKYRLEKKEYVVRDGDIIHFRFNV